MKKQQHNIGRVMVLAALLSIATLIDSSAQTGAVSQPNEEQLAKIEATKVAVITSKLELTTEQAKEFWPVYNDYNLKRKNLKKSMRALMVKAENFNVADPDEDEAREHLKRFQTLQGQFANTDQEYSEKLLKIIRPSQLLKLYSAEREVMRMLVKEMGKHHHYHDERP